MEGSLVSEILPPTTTEGQGLGTDGVAAAVAESVRAVRCVELQLVRQGGALLALRLAVIRVELLRLAGGLPVRTDTVLRALGVNGFEVPPGEPAEPVLAEVVDA